MEIQELQHIEFRNSKLWKTKFVELKIFQGEPQDKSNEILKSGTSLPDKFICQKKVAFAMLSALGSSYMF